MAENNKGERSLRGAGRTFTKEILVPILLALIVIQFVIQAFKIPSASMEDSLLIGDFLLGLKFVFGSPLPFSNKKLPGLTDPKPGDVLIFKYPGDPEYPEGNPDKYRFVANLFLFGNLYWDRTPRPDQNHLVWYSPKDFIKRCIAQSGQTITVSGEKLFIDGKESILPPRGKHKEQRIFEPVRDSLVYRLPVPGETFDFDTLSLKYATWMRSLAAQENPDSRVELHLDMMKDSTVANDYMLPYLRGSNRNPVDYEIYPLLLQALPAQRDSAGFSWLEAENVPFKLIQDVARIGYVRTTEWPSVLGYNPADKDAATAHRGDRRTETNEYFIGALLDLVNENIRGQGAAAGHRYWIKPSLVIDGKSMHTYTVKKKCYFMMGDNRDNSSDSRYWGLLSKDFVKAKAFIIYFSFENDDDRFAFTNPFSWLLIPQKIRWTRIGKLID